MFIDLFLSNHLIIRFQQNFLYSNRISLDFLDFADFHQFYPICPYISQFCLNSWFCPIFKDSIKFCSSCTISLSCQNVPNFERLEKLQDLPLFYLISPYLTLLYQVLFYSTLPNPISTNFSQFLLILTDFTGWGLIFSGYVQFFQIVPNFAKNIDFSTFCNICQIFLIVLDFTKLCQTLQDFASFARFCQICYYFAWLWTLLHFLQNIFIVCHILHGFASLYKFGRCLLDCPSRFLLHFFIRLWLGQMTSDPHQTFTKMETFVSQTD